MMEESEYLKKYPVPEVEWWTYEEYKEWLENEKKELQSILGATGTGNGKKIVWTQEKIDETIAMYEEMLQDDGVELVYIATPHSHHAQHAKLCIEYGRPVLCEKAFTWTAEEAEEVLRLAKEKQVFITEAMWVRYMPMFRMLKETVDSGKIGAVTAVTANLGYALLHKERVTRPELAGGALLDLGVYTLNFATGLLGDEPERIETTMVRLITGVDKQEFVNLIYPNGVVAGLFNTMVSVTDRKGFIYGTEGHIEVENINNYEEFRIYNNQYELTETIRRPEQLTGYEYEVRACHRALLNGQLECEEMPHVHTMRIMHMLDENSEKWEEAKGMKSSQELKKQLRQIDHKGYKAYKVLEGEYDFGAYRLCIDHVQGDPFATPSRVRIVYKNEIPVKFFDRPYRRTATEDALLRRLHGNLFRASKGGGRRGSGKAG